MDLRTPPTKVARERMTKENMVNGDRVQPWLLHYPIMMNVGYIYDGRGTSYRTNGHNKAAAFSFSSRQRRHGRQHHYNHHHPPVMQDHQQQQTEPVRPPNADPEKLMTLLKSSGEYDRLRKQIFTTFQNSVCTTSDTQAMVDLHIPVSGYEKGVIESS
jgi:hypothetical protein